jgi:RND family efflux transporter MFP subunit
MTHNRPRSGFFAAALAAALAVGGCRREQARPTAASQPTIALSADDVARVERGAIQTGPRVAGALEARRRSVIRAEVGGPVLSVGPELGEAVKRGDLLARIGAKGLDDAVRSAQAAVDSAAAQREVARRDLARYEALARAGAASGRELEVARGAALAADAAARQARAQLGAARSQLGGTVVRAPISGVVASRAVNQGDIVAPGAPLYEIIDPQAMRLSASVPSDALGALAVGDPVVFEIRGYPGQTFEGAIGRIAPAADAATRQIPILVDIPNPGGRLVAGLFAEGRVAAASKVTLLAPLSAIDTSGDRPSVLRVRDGAVERV